ncbi:murein hydrolase activator EnvC family protein [Candidatus Poriferisodalis sp.]|uniref:murein hydrolase activator EnvC family protein n=1 Tax=Candidatus Poriferisodalis sp. TaxID=3101277 RepID=UPI003B52C26E
MAAGTAPASAQAESALTYIWPVHGTIVDHFRPPKHEYGSGNRGLEFATRPGSSFWAAARGVVSFAGPVGGRLHVTVSHPDGLRVSYSGVADIGVNRGERVHQGQLLGTTADRLHVGVRRGEAYLDPALIFDGDAGTGVRPPLSRPRLVPASTSVYRLQLRWLHSGAGIAVL